LRRKKEAVIDGARLAQFEKWHASRPKLPEGKRPKKAGWNDNSIIDLFMFLAFVSFIVGVAVVLMAPLPEMPTIGGVIFWAGPILYPGIVIGLMFAVMTVNDFVGSRAYEQSGWAKYDRDLERWKLIGDEDFGDLARTDRMINLRMWSVYDGHPPRIEQISEELKKQALRRRVPTSEPELDALEDALDNATPGPRHSIILASPRYFRREARHLARSKAACESRDERFIAQISVPATRAIGRNSAGWYSNMSITDRETAAVRAEITPYFEAAGLRVTKCWLSWNGMSVGSGGNYESLGVVVRVA